jgi:hypothetical protein
VREYEQVGSLIYLRLTECILDGQVVGQRAYDHDGRLMIETPLKDGKKHGREYTWREDGTLLSVEPYAGGKIHGLAKQYGQKGKVIGTYRMKHGTGLDVWRQEVGDGVATISEIHSLQDGRPHGYEWWFSGIPPALWHECHWRAGEYHGIERQWNKTGKLRHGYPKYWIRGEQATQRQYMNAMQTDKTLPVYRDRDNAPRRKFPAEIDDLLSSK